MEKIGISRGRGGHMKNPFFWGYEYYLEVLIQLEIYIRKKTPLNFLFQFNKKNSDSRS